MGVAFGIPFLFFAWVVGVIVLPIAGRVVAKAFAEEATGMSDADNTPRTNDKSLATWGEGVEAADELTARVQAASDRIRESRKDSARSAD